MFNLQNTSHPTLTKNPLTYAVVALLVLVVFATDTRIKENSNEKFNKTVSIGAILPLSGDLSFVGTQMQKGIELALSEYDKDEIKIVFEDDQTYNDIVAINALNKLIDVDKVDVVFNVAVNTIKSLDSTLEKNNIPGIVLWDSNKTIQNLRGDIYGFGYSTEKTGEKMARYVYRKLGIRSVAVITTQDEWSEIISSVFMEKFIGLGGNVTVQKRVAPDENDFKSVLLFAKNKKSEAVYFPLFSPEPTLKLAKQARELGFETLLTGDGLVDIGTDSEGVYSTQAWIDDAGFAEKYQNFFGEETSPVGLSFSGLGYDAVHFIMSVVENIVSQGKRITPENINDEIKNIEVRGVMGTTSFNKNNKTDRVQSITVVKDGRLEFVE